MLNSIWAVLILLAVFGAAATGNLTALSKAAADGAQSAVETALLLMGAMCLWLGLMNIASHAGLTEKVSRILSPLICRLFPEYAAHTAVGEKISMNIAANMLGMGNAATPLGLAAMDEMQRISGGDTPTRGMVLFVVMNTAAFQLIPSSVVTLRAAYGSANPYDIMVHIWFVSIGSLLTCIFVCKLFERLQKA